MLAQNEYWFTWEFHSPIFFVIVVVDDVGGFLLLLLLFAHFIVHRYMAPFVTEMKAVFFHVVSLPSRIVSLFSIALAQDFVLRENYLPCNEIAWRERWQETHRTKRVKKSAAKNSFVLFFFFFFFCWLNLQWKKGNKFFNRIFNTKKCIKIEWCSLEWACHK